jgi:phosphoglycerate kinase
VSYPSIRQADLRGKRVFLRADLNVPLENGVVADDNRIVAVLPTLEAILAAPAAVILASHLGRPDGKVVPGMSLAPVASVLEKHLGRPVILAPDCVGRRVETMAAALRPGDVLLLENLRFHAEEEAGGEEFSRLLAGLADVYVNDAFGTCHRAHASMTGVPGILGGGYVGFLVEKELQYLLGATSNPRRPMTLLLGGAKVSDKLPVIENLLGKTDTILIGGGMAFTFLRARGLSTGKSLLDADRVELARKTMERAEAAGVRIVLPVDVVVAPSPDSGASAVTVPVDRIPEDQAGLDIGEASVREFTDVVLQSRTVVWNGPMGFFEKPPFDRATRALASALADATDAGAVTIIGGGDSARAVSEAGVENRVSFVSTGGGVSLDLLQGKELVALRALSGTKR